MKGKFPGCIALVLGLLAAGCGGRTLPLIEDSESETLDGASSQAMGSGGSGGGANEITLVPLVPNDAGIVNTAAVGVIGKWYAYGDEWGIARPPGPCDDPQLGGFAPSQCSSIVFPRSPLVSPETSPGTFCLKGTAAKVIGSPPGYADIYGIGIGLDLDNSGGVRVTYDAPAYHVIGFEFDIANLPTAAGGQVRVELPTRLTDSRGYSSWGKALANPLPNDGKNTQIRFDHLEQLFFSGAEPPPFDPTQLLSILFHVPSVDSNAVPVTDLCVSNLRAIVEN